MLGERAVSVLDPQALVSAGEVVVEEVQAHGVGVELDDREWGISGIVVNGTRGTI
ncbi:MAG: hypothetical protein ACYCPT_06930 [Acidimicrobiales bacterium]